MLVRRQGEKRGPHRLREVGRIKDRPQPPVKTTPDDALNERGEALDELSRRWTGAHSRLFEQPVKLRQADWHGLLKIIWKNAACFSIRNRKGPEGKRIRIRFCS